MEPLTNFEISRKTKLFRMVTGCARVQGADVLHTLALVFRSAGRPRPIVELVHTPPSAGQRDTNQWPDLKRVCPIVSAMPEESRAGIFREHLGTAKVDAPAFFVETATHLMIDFRSIRDSGITWRFLAEHRAEVVQRKAGHEHISTTLGYAKEVQDRLGRYG